MSVKTTRDREITALQEAMTERRINEGVIVTLDEEETITGHDGTIQVIPAWKSE